MKGGLGQFSFAEAGQYDSTESFLDNLVHFSRGIKILPVIDVFLQGLPCDTRQAIFSETAKYELASAFGLRVKAWQGERLL